MTARPRLAPPSVVSGRVGDAVRRPDAGLKTRGDFPYSSDLQVDGMLWGATVRSPHPYARIISIDTSRARSMPGVRAVLTHEDVPGRKVYGLEIPDQPVLAMDVVRYWGEAVALVAADHPERARRAAQEVLVQYEVLAPLTNPELALTDDAPRLHPDGNITRQIKIRRGDQDPHADVVVRGEYEVGMQDQAPLGPESGLAVPDGEGGIDLYIATQWLHVDRDQLANSLGLPPEKVRLTLAGIGGAFGAREDLSMQAHACMLAMRTGEPVKMAYSRAESFVGHVHRHPARLRYEHGATRDGKLVYVKARILLDGGAYASSSTAVISNACCFAVGPYDCPNATIDGWVVYTNNPPCGAMRGFGSVQNCYAHEAQMDKLAAALEMDPVELRIRNAMQTGSRLITGQAVDGPVPVADLLRSVKAMPMPPARTLDHLDLTQMPGGVSNTTHGEGVRRGIGYAVGFKNVGYSEGFNDYSTARVRLSVVGGRPRAEVHTAGADVGQGLVMVQAQIAGTELGVRDVVVLNADTQVGSAGSSSASRQTYITGGAVKTACEAVRERVLALAESELSGLGRGEAGSSGSWRLENDAIVSGDGNVVITLATLLGEEVIDETREFRPRRTARLDAETGQANAHMQFAFAAHRAVVDVDIELGLVKVVELATAQDVGKAINPQAVEGQLEGGAAQGLGLAVMEEIQLKDGVIRNPSFTDYLIPTTLDMPPVRMDILELGDPNSPYGVKGAGEPPTISSGPAIVAAIRAASGRPLVRVPVRPHDLVDT
ncbi:MAG: xanthine dehydrogenase subunit D [Actinobacteria bacterium 13_1_40CM_2_65_8]|nr:MAG: xanthine dehydrogenase subunit D [Actinobacteria bacterium 13_1_40CM_4_65_12]OLD48765.1 MAG: xanthine dehydrogenase subunit D [Actinobacteria bacterium 13_1_40CM_2_65_8]